MKLRTMHKEMLWFATKLRRSTVFSSKTGIIQKIGINVYFKSDVEIGEIWLSLHNFHISSTELRLGWHQ